MANQTAKTLVSYYDKVLEQLNKDTTMARRVEVDTVSGASLQNANNIYWRNVEQQSPVLEGWDLTGQETGIIEQAYPLRLQDPRNDFVSLRVDELRDTGFMDRRVRSSAAKLSADQNSRIADLVASTGSLYYESSAVGFDFVAEADTIMTERQANRDSGASFFLSPRANQVMASDLASRSTLDGRPLEAYETAMIGRNVAGFDLFRGSYVGNINARANATTTTVADDVLEIPQGFTETNGTLQNVDYRVGTVTLTAGTNYNVGDVITFAGVNALAVMDKRNTGELMTFRIVGKTGDVISIYPKPIAANQAGITPEQAAYANISTAIVETMVVSKVNENGGRANSFWADDSICIVNGDAPLDMLNEFDGMKVVSETLDSGVKLYMAYDASLPTLNCRVRLFTWYGLVNKDPSRNGNAIYVPE
jgi:hypothetical protein